jgi:hypothetical protein
VQFSGCIFYQLEQSVYVPLKPNASLSIVLVWQELTDAVFAYNNGLVIRKGIVEGFDGTLRVDMAGHNCALRILHPVFVERLKVNRSFV